ncbi:MAG: PEP-CTERM sorting domain-containing protein, partial [Planctomycetota bacterium]
PGEGKPGFDLIPGWTGEGSGGGGAETGWGPTDGLYTGFTGGNMEVFQLTGHTIAAGDVYTLTVDARRTWEGPNITLGLYYDDGGARVQMASLFHEFVGGATTNMEELNLVALAGSTAAAIGNNLGIQIMSGDPDAAWIGFDSVRLDVVPEPATLALLGFGALGLIRRRRA